MRRVLWGIDAFFSLSRKEGVHYSKTAEIIYLLSIVIQKMGVRP